MKTTVGLLIATAAGLWGVSTHTAPWSQGEQFQLTGDRVAVYDLAGEVTIEASSGSAVIVQLTRQGSDADQIRVEHGLLEGRNTLRVIFPGDRVHYGGRDGGSTELRVRDDGTFGGNGQDRGRRVRISSREDGLDARADLRVLVPPGKSFDLYLAVGRVSATNVRGDLRLDTHSAPVTTTGTRGTLVIDVGSGHVDASDHEGDLNFDTGSGSVDVTGVRGDELRIDTGSGSVTATRIAVANLDIDTGSGGVDVTGSVTRDILIDTGSGSVDLALSTNPQEIEIDTGSGSVTMTVPESFGASLEVDTGSGGITVDFPITMRRWERSHVTGTVGDGQARVTIDTGSGSVQILRN